MTAHCMHARRARQQLQLTATGYKCVLGLRQWRDRLGLTQAEVARRVGSSQSRVAKMEAADKSVSTDLLLRVLFHLGAKRQDVARLLAAKSRSRAA